MKTAFVVALAFTLLCAVIAAPADEIEVQGENKKAADSDAINRILESQDAVEAQGITESAKKLLGMIKSAATTITNKCGKKVLTSAIDCLTEGRKKANEQHSFDEADKQDEQLVRDLLRSVMLSKDATSVEMQVTLNDLKAAAWSYFTKCGGTIAKSAGKCILDILFTDQAQEEGKKVEEQHSFQKAAKQNEDLLLDLVSRILQE